MQVLPMSLESAPAGEYSSGHDDVSELRRTEAEAAAPSQPVQQGHEGVRTGALEVRDVRCRELWAVADRGRVTRGHMSTVNCQ
jgi:hypothetical protein